VFFVILNYIKFEVNVPVIKNVVIGVKLPEFKHDKSFFTRYNAFECVLSLLISCLALDKFKYIVCILNQVFPN